MIIIVILHSVNHEASISQTMFALFCVKVVIRRRDPVTSTRIRKSQYLATFKLDINKCISSYLFFLPNILWVPFYMYFKT